MADEKMMRLSQVARKLNVGRNTITDFLANKGFEVDSSPNSKITPEQFTMLAKEFESSALDKEEASGLTIGKKHVENFFIDSDEDNDRASKNEEEDEIFIKNSPTKKEAEAPKQAEKEIKESPKKEETKPATGQSENLEDKGFTQAPKLQGIRVVGKIDLSGKKPQPPLDKDTEKPSPTAPVETPSSDKVAPKVEEIKPEPTEAKNVEETAQTKDTTGKSEEQEAKKEATAGIDPNTETEAPKAEDIGIKETISTEATKAEEKKEEEKPKEPEIKEEKKELTAKAGEEKVEEKTIEARADTLRGLTVLGKIELPKEKKKKAKPVASSDDQRDKKKKKRPRKRLGSENDQKARPARPTGTGAGSGTSATTGTTTTSASPTGGAAKKFQGKVDKNRRPGRAEKEELTDKEIQDKIKATLAKLSGNKKGGGNVNRSKYRREKRSAIAEANEERILQEQEEAKILKVTEFISANDLASLMDVSVNEVISACMSLGMFVSINQRLDAESITVIADEFGYNVEFSGDEDEIEIEEVEDTQEELIERAPIVTIMGHVDHGKTSLLDYIRSTKVTSGEAGGITQHIGAYDVTTDTGKRVSFLDTPGHEAFTAMRARGAKLTDVVIIVVAADDNVMPQTKEAINHAQVAGVPIVIAINKIDKPNANPDKIKEELSKINILVEDWGGKYQCQEISAKTGAGINDLLEKVLLEAELLELKANPNKLATGTVIEASLDRGRGYVTTILVQSGTLKVGDVILAGAHYGKVKAMFDHLGQRVQKAGPSTPVAILGLDGAPQAGDKFNSMEAERDAREIANKREQIQREQKVRTKKHITLDEIGRRLAIGSFKELNVIVKGDVDGSIEALSDSLLKLSTNEVQVNIIHKAVGQISESDVLLASASDAIIVGFQVRPSNGARRIAEQEEIEIRLYSIIYDAINEIKDAMEGMLAPKVEEVITGNAEVREVFKITKVGTVAGCYITEGFIKRNNKIRLVRDGIVIYTGEIDQLKRFKDDVGEVRSGYECGMSVKNFNDIQLGDNLEGFTEKEVKRKL